ncbi:hypothetical protein ACP4OV_003840 [Aristida adscensionis]
MAMKKAAMRMHVPVVCSAVGTLGLVTVILGVSGEAYTARALVRRVAADSPGGGYRCVYQTTPALGCGVVAALFALTAQVLGTAAACCGCFRNCELPIGTNRIVGIVLSFLSWVIVLITVALFIAGGAFNTDREAQATTDDKCYVAPGIELFATATVLSLIATGFQIASYILLQPPAAGSSSSSSPVATGEPVKAEPQQGAEHAAANGGGGAPAPPSFPASFEANASEPTNRV